eukprot:743416-Prymnesium_polylepis.1
MWCLPKCANSVQTAQGHWPAATLPGPAAERAAASDGAEAAPASCPPGWLGPSIRVAALAPL